MSTCVLDLFIVLFLEAWVSPRRSFEPLGSQRKKLSGRRHSFETHENYVQLLQVHLSQSFFLSMLAVSSSNFDDLDTVFGVHSRAGVLHITVKHTIVSFFCFRQWIDISMYSSAPYVASTHFLWVPSLLFSLKNWCCMERSTRFFRFFRNQLADAISPPPFFPSFVWWGVPVTFCHFIQFFPARTTFNSIFNVFWHVFLGAIFIQFLCWWSCVSRARIFFGRATHALFKQSHTWSLVQFDHVVFVSGCFFGVGCPVNCHVLSHVHVAFFVGPISWFFCVPLTPVYFHTDLIPSKIEWWWWWLLLLL